MENPCMEEVEAVHDFELRRAGGKWLGAARDYLQRVPNAQHVRHGSDEPVLLTVRQIEEMASQVAAAALNERQEVLRRISGIRPRRIAPTQNS